MTLYHGSNVEIKAVDFLESKVGKDFGVGFYLSPELQQALDTVYNSETYTKVLDLRTGLYSQSTAYVYSILETEILTGKLG